MEGVLFRNWSNTYSCAPELFFSPKTEQEIEEILSMARTRSKKVRVVGWGHSPSDLACTDGYIISLKNFNKVISIDKEKRQITVQGGMTLEDLNEIHLPQYDLALSVLGSVSDITVGGAISTGTHGTGMKFGIFSSYVIHIKLMKPDGKILVCSANNNKDIFHAALCSIGCLGILIEATLQCEEKFNLIENQYSADLCEVITNLGIHVQAVDHFKFMWFPHTDKVVVYDCSRTDKNIVKKPLLTRLRLWILDYLVGFYLLEFCYFISAFFPSIVPTINNWFYELIYTKSRRQVDVSHKIFNFNCPFKFYVTEWAVDIKKTCEVLYALKEWLEINRDVFVHFPVEVRFVKADNIFISPAYGRDTCYINIIMYSPYGKDVPRERYWSAFEKIMEDAEGRPHWAKAHKITAEKFHKMYPLFDSWCSIRSEIDPTNMFFNDYMARVFWKKIKEN